MSVVRKLRRNRLKRMMGNNKIKQAYHERYDTLEQKIRRDMSNGEGKRGDRKTRV